MPRTHLIPDGIAVLERGWLSSNNIVLRGAPGELGDVVIDSGHVNHAAQTVQLIGHVLQGRPPAMLVNTHLHSDHCGGNAALQAAFGMPTAMPPGQADAVRDWDQSRLPYAGSRQRIERFGVDRVITPGEHLRAGGRDWEVIGAPGHDPHSVMLFERDSGPLISADALWEDGFGVIFPEVTGEPGFDDAAAVLDLIATLPVRCVIPGHGAPFTDAGAALTRAGRRLDAFRADPARHLRYAIKVFLKYHVMEERELPLTQLLRWAEATPLMQSAWQLHPPRGVATLTAWIKTLVEELCASGAVAHDGGRIIDR